MALKTIENNDISRFILINAGQSLGKQNFTICHELYHLFIQKSFTSRVCNTGLFDKKIDKEEYYADVFASYLLLPTDGLLEFIPDVELSAKKVTLKTIVYLEQFFSCSRRALLYRLIKMKLINTLSYEKYTQGVKKSAIELGYSTSLYEKGNINVVIGDYGTTAKELYDKEIISQSHFYSLLSDLGIDINALESVTDVGE
jgi:Zn-dependent peptidase ImmA (M78 family)